MATEADLVTTPDLATMNSLFRDFLLTNPSSSIVEATNEEHRFTIIEPWGDNSLELLIPSNPLDLAHALNRIKLPHRLSALWHTVSDSLEVIWTATHIGGPQGEIVGRAFAFNYDGGVYKCSFEDSSTDLMTIAECLVTRGPSLSFWRNLVSYQQYSRFKDHPHLFGLDRPRSFWIHGISGLTDERLADLITNLNFYLRYYDDRSPLVLVHDPRIDDVSPRTRYIAGSFPTEINARRLDANLVSFWNATESGNPMLRFLIYYRILEYASSLYVESHIRSEVRRLLDQPHLSSNKEVFIERMAIAVSKSKLDDLTKLKLILKDTVNPALIWRDLQNNIEVFSRNTEFQGGFTVGRLCQSNETEVGYCNPASLDNLAYAFRKIRNALSHGMDQETAGVITPSPYNQKLFLPWVHLIQTAAGEVVLFRDSH